MESQGTYLLHLDNIEIEEYDILHDLKLLPEEEVLAHKYEYRWSDDVDTLNKLWREGFEKVRQNNRYPELWLMRKERNG